MEGLLSIEVLKRSSVARRTPVYRITEKALLSIKISSNSFYRHFWETILPVEYLLKLLYLRNIIKSFFFFIKTILEALLLIENLKISSVYKGGDFRKQAFTHKLQTRTFKSSFDFRTPSSKNCSGIKSLQKLLYFPNYFKSFMPMKNP